MTKRPAGQTTYSARSPFSAQPAEVAEVFEVEDRVTHDRLGLGRISVVEAAAVVVDFGSERVRVVSPFRKLTKL